MDNSLGAYWDSVQVGDTSIVIKDAPGARGARFSASGAVMEGCAWARIGTPCAFFEPHWRRASLTDAAPNLKKHKKNKIKIKLKS